MFKKILIKILFLNLIIFCKLPALYLFDKYPELKKQISYVSLGIYPTPVYNFKSIAKKYNLKNFYIKDDGAYGPKDQYNKTLPSGNKMRKLEFLLAEAIFKNYKTVCTVGSAGSNHALETAICAKQLGLETVLLLNDQRPTSYTIRNLKLMSLFAKKVRYTAVDDDQELMQQAQEICQKEHFYYIPMGGSNSIGDLGYINAIFELKDQINKKILEEPDYIYVTLGSSGTATGIILGAKAAGLKSKIIPVRISFTAEYKTNLLTTHVNQTGAWLNTLDKNFNFKEEKPEDLNIEHNFAGGENSYALITQEGSQAIEFLNSIQEKDFPKIKLEGTYTGKTLSALLDHAKSGLLKDKNVLFWNTFSYGKFKEFTDTVTDEQIKKVIAPELWHYLTDKLQDLDQGI